jgi:ActR/RegA family two-component response regulator
MSSETHASGIGNKVMLVGIDNNHILERRLQAAGCQVIKVTDEEAALDHVRHEIFDKAVMVLTGPLIDTAEMIFSLRDLNRSMEIIILVDRPGKYANRLLRQLLLHPIAGTQIMTRRQLQKALHGAAAPAHAGKELPKPHP